MAFQGVPTNRIWSLKLENGKTIIEDEYVKIKTVLVYENLFLKDKAIYNAKNARRWLAYPPLDLISAVGLGLYNFFICENGIEMSGKSAFITATFGVGSLSSYIFIG